MTCSDPHSVAELVRLGRLALLNRCADDALGPLNEALALQPDHAEALALKGIYWMQRKDFERAIESLERAKAADTSLAMVYFNLGKSYARLRRFPPAEENLHRAIEINPNHFEAYSQLSYVQTQTGRLEDSIHSMLRAIRINPRFVKGYLVLECLYERAGQREAVMRLYRFGADRNPDAFLLRERLCALYALNGDFRSAFEEALQIVNRRNSYTDHLRLGTYAVALQKFETAEKAFRTAVSLNPAKWEGHYNLAEVYMSARLMDQAREHYQAALENSRDNYEPFNGLGLFVLIVDQDCDRAIDLFKQAIDLAPFRPEPRLNLALACAKKRDFAAAGKVAASVLTMTRPGDPIHDQAERLQGTIRIENRTFRALK